MRDGQIIFRHEGSEVAVARRDEIPLRGEHNVENVLAACAAAYLAGATPAAIASGVKTFRGVEHRLEFVAEVGGVKFYNDSKATNVDAALKAIEAFSGPLIVILGGKDKGSPYTPLARAAARTGAPRDSDRRGRRKDRGRSGRRGRNRRTRARLTEPCSWRANARGRATWCCSRRRARASTNSRTTSSAGEFSRSWSRGSKGARDRPTPPRETKG